MSQPLSPERLAEIEVRYGVGRSNLTAGTKQELRQAVHELIAEVRRTRKASALPDITDGITDAEAEASAELDLTIDELRTLKADRDGLAEHARGVAFELGALRVDCVAHGAMIRQLRTERDAARAELEQLRAGYRNVGDYRIGTDGDNPSGDSWPYVACTRCRDDIWNGRHVGGEGLDVATLLSLIAGHHCDATAPGAGLSATETDRQGESGAEPRTGVPVAPAGQTGACIHDAPCPVCDYETERPT